MNEGKKKVAAKKTKAPATRRKAPAKVGLEAPVYDAAGKKAGTISLPERVFGARWNPDLVHQAVTVMEANARIPYAHTKDRGEVRGGGRKPWQQKGTGRARHGSIRSPLWRGGGITFGPRKEEVFARALPKKMRAQALFSSLSKKYQDGEILFVEHIALAEPKTADAKKILDAISGISGFEKVGTKSRNAIFIAQAKRDGNVEKSFRNFSHVEVGEARNINPRDVLSHTYVLFLDPEVGIQEIAKRAVKK
jgi:large subunit ribosomal protein L4